MKKIVAGILLSLFLPTQVQAECICTTIFKVWATTEWKTFAGQFVTSAGIEEETLAMAGLAKTMNFHKALMYKGLSTMAIAQEAASKNSNRMKHYRAKSQAEIDTNLAYKADHIDRMAKQAMEMQQLMRREKTLLQDTAVNPAVQYGSGSGDCVDQQHDHALHASAGAGNLLEQKQLGREAMRHESGQATEVTQTRKEAAEAYTKAREEAGQEETTAHPTNGMLVFPTNDLYKETRNMIRKIVELEKPFENAEKLHMNEAHEREYIALRDAYKLVTNILTEGVEAVIDPYAPTLSETVIDILLDGAKNNDDYRAKLVNRDRMSSIAAESDAFAELQLSAAMSEHLNSDNSGSETALLLGHIVAMEQRRNKLMHLLATLLASEDLLPGLGHYLETVRINAGEKL